MKRHIYMYTAHLRCSSMSSDDLINKKLVCFCVDPRCYDQEIWCLILYFFVNVLFFFSTSLSGSSADKKCFFLPTPILIESKWEKAWRSKCTELITSFFFWNTCLLKLPGNHMFLFSFISADNLSSLDGVLQGTKNFQSFYLRSPFYPFS